MKKIIKVLFVIPFYLGFLCPTASSALDLYGFGSYWDKEDTDGTWGAGIGASINLLTEHLKFDGRIYFFENSDVSDEGELELYPLDFGLQVHILPDQKFDPYILGGISYIYADSDQIDVDSDFGAYLGAGLDYQLGNLIKPFAELVFRSAELGSDIGISNEDIDVSGVTANIGLKIDF